MQKCRPPSFFHTSTTALHQALWLGLMAPDSSISFRWLLTSSTIGGGIHLNCSLKWVLSVTFMICSVEWVQPNSVGSNENMSWYLARSQWAVSASSGVQESRLLKSNSSNNLPCLCLTVSLGVWELGDSLVPSWSPSDFWILGTGNAVTALATRVFLGGSVDRQHYSVPLQLPFCYLFLTQCMHSAWSGQEARCHPESIRPVP